MELVKEDVEMKDIRRGVRILKWAKRNKGEERL